MLQRQVTSSFRICSACTTRILLNFRPPKIIEEWLHLTQSMAVPIQCFSLFLGRMIVVAAPTDDPKTRVMLISCDMVISVQPCCHTNQVSRGGSD